MRIIKLALISAVFFSVLITLFSLLFPSRVRISKAIDITADRQAILAQLSDTGNWKYWYPGADSARILPEIRKSTDSSVVAETRLEKGKKGVTGWNLYETPQPRTLTLQWFMDFHLRWYPWEKFSGLLLEKRYGPLMEKGLENLKTLLEANP
ncbi:MAG: hypothetical protein ACO25B_03890 [Chitinophagaceae bacterium]